MVYSYINAFDAFARKSYFGLICVIPFIIHDGVSQVPDAWQLIVAAAASYPELQVTEAVAPNVVTLPSLAVVPSDTVGTVPQSEIDGHR